ncbi:MAG: flavodoxin family protein [Proteobacteria bacterium]|nr:flavodoxin family protein [Pseudomonadota bacterium]
MKITAINASHRGDEGFTHFLINKIATGAAQQGALFETVVLTKHRINRCIGCQACHTEKSYLKCIYEDKDDVKEIFDKMREADILIFATPVYLFNMSGLLKIFLDRINSTGDSCKLQLSKSGLFFHHIDHELCSKPLVLLVCCDNLEDETPKNVISYFRTYSKFMDAPIVGTLVRKSGKLIGHGKSSEKEKQYPKIYDVYEAFQQAGKDLATTGRISPKTQKRANQHIINIPSVFNILMKFRPFKKRAIEKAKTIFV